MNTATLIASAAATVYAAGILVFLMFYRDRVLGGRFQAAVTAMAWPLLVVFLLMAR